MAGNNTIGTGALILSANADNALMGLDRLEKGANKTKQQLDKVGGGGAGGGLLSFLGGAVGGASGRVLGPMVEKIGEGISRWVFNTNKWETSLRGATEAANLASRAMDRGLKSQEEKLNSLRPGDKAAEIEAQTSALRLQLKEQERIRDVSNENAAFMKDLTNPTAMRAWRQGAQGMLIDLANMKASKADEAIGKLRDRLADLNDAAKKIKDPTKNFGLIGEINQLTEALKLQADTFGMTANQAQIYALKAKGATDAMLAPLQAAADRLDAMQKQTAAPQGPQNVGAMQRGSAEAFTIIARAQNAPMQTEAAKQLKELQGIKMEVRNLVKAITGVELVKVI